MVRVIRIVCQYLDRLYAIEVPEKFGVWQLMFRLSRVL
jgi:hypothetical protein